MSKSIFRGIALVEWAMPKSAEEVLKGGGGCFLACEESGRIFDNSFPACAFVVVVVVAV